MTFAILGSGAIGGALAAQFARSNVSVRIANSRGPESLAELVKRLGPSIVPVDLAEALAADIVILAIPFTGIADALRGTSFEGRVVVDASNAIDFPAFTPTDLGGRPSSLVVAEHASGAQLVKAFNTLPAATLAADPREDKRRRVLFLSGNETSANDKVRDLIEMLGFCAIDLGRLDQGGLLMQFGGALTNQDLLRL